MAGNDIFTRIGRDEECIQPLDRLIGEPWIGGRCAGTQGWQCAYILHTLSGRSPSESCGLPRSAPQADARIGGGSEQAARDTALGNGLAI